METIIEIASRISTPLALAGLLAAFLFFIFRQIINTGILPELTKKAGGTIILAIINKLFVLALGAMVLGFGGYVLTIIVRPNEIEVSRPNIEAVSPGTSPGGQQLLEIKYTGQPALPVGVQAEVQVAADQDFHAIWTTQRIPDWQAYRVTVGFSKPDARTGFVRITIVDTAGTLLIVSDVRPFSLYQEVSP
jgi:hypothetical protein